MVRESGCLLDSGKRDDVFFFQSLAADGEVLHRTLGLSAIQRVYWNLYFAHGVVFDAVFQLVPLFLEALEAPLL